MPKVSEPIHTMPWKCESVHALALHAARSAEDYALHAAALEWSITDPIIINGAEDIKSRPGWQGRLEPFEHQVRNLFTFCRRLPVTLLADDVGLGKTISAGLILSELMVRRRVARALVICPSILAPQWEEELGAKFGITAKVAKGKELAQELNRPTPVVVTTYDSARDHIEFVEAGTFGMLILDEAHKLRNLHGTSAAPQMAVRLYKALERRAFKYVLMLTATPIHNRLWDIYSLVDYLTVAKGQKNPFGTPEDFRSHFLVSNDGRRPKVAQAEDFRSVLRQYLTRTRRGDARLKFPTREVTNLLVDLTPGEKELMRMAAAHIGKLNGLQQSSLAVALMSSPQALAVQMRNMVAGGGIPESVANDAFRLAEGVRVPGKLDRLIVFLDKLRAEKPTKWRAVIFTGRKETQQLIGRVLGERGVRCGFIQGGEARQNQLSLERFRSDPPEVNVIISGDLGAEGINLQAANVLVNYDLPWNPMTVEQRIGRVQRLKSDFEHVIVVNLVAIGTVEERVVGRLLEKLQVISHALGDIEAILESADFGEEDGGKRFEEVIRDLVVKSLIGQDVQQAIETQQLSIERGRRQLEECRQEIDKTLGPLDHLHSAGPAMPKLTRLAPSVPAPSFVLRAFQASGARVEEVCPLTFKANLPGRKAELITFDETAATADGRAVFHGNSPRLYLPGHPAFERLTQHWVDRAGHRMRDLRPFAPAQAVDLAKRWCEGLPGATFLRAEFTPRGMTLQGSGLVKAKAGNAVDSYEKLLTCALPALPGHAPLPAPDHAVGGTEPEIDPAQVSSSLRFMFAAVVEADKDVRGFCDFYEERLREELEKAGDDERARHKVTGDLNPAVFAEIVALEGGQYSFGRLAVHFSFDEVGTYQVDLEVIPANGQVLSEPARQPCARTNRIVPESCLEPCAVSKQRVLRHLLDKSELTGRYALPEHVVVCPVSGKRVLSDEMGRSAITGQSVAVDLLNRSPVSGRLGLPSDFQRCDVTGTLVLRDELEPSAVSGRLFRSDERAESAVSGKAGHRSEFITCAYTRKPILESESANSDYSRRRVRRDRLRTSDKAPRRVGTPDEFVVCGASGANLLRDEAGQSAVSGRWYDLELLSPSEKDSRRLGASNEFVTCAATGKRLLVDEAAQSSIDGKWYDRDLLRPSQKNPQRLGLASDFVMCDLTGLRLLSDEAGQSALDGRWHDRILLHASEKNPRRLGLAGDFVTCASTGRRLLRDEARQSAVSGKWHDRDLLRTSAKSGKWALPQELETCGVSGSKVLPGELETCAVTGKRVLGELLKRSAVSGAWVLPALAASAYALPDGAEGSRLGRVTCLPSETIRCEWIQLPILKDQSGTCRLTGCGVLKRFLSRGLELRPLRLLLNGDSRAVLADDLIPWLLKQNRREFAGIKHVWRVAGPQERAWAICAEVRSLLGMRRRYLGLLIKAKSGEPKEILGRIVRGRRDGAVWIQESAD